MNHKESSGDWKSFICLLVVQTQNAFNDNFARFLLVPLIAFLAKLQIESSGETSLNTLQHVLAVSLVVPFLLFSPFAGWLADRLPKNRVIRWSSWLQMIVLIALAIALWLQSLLGACVAFFFLATQSALLSPAKMGIVKEQIGQKKLALASGVMEMFVILAILGGQIWANFLFSARVKELNPWDAALWPVVVLAATTIIALITAYGMKLTPAQSSVPLKAKTLVSHFSSFKMLFRDLKLGKPALMVAYFWGFGGFINLVCIQAASTLTGGGTEMGTTLAWMLVAASGGIATGAGYAGWMSRKRIELGLAPLGGIIMVVSLFLLSIQTVGAPGFYIFLAITGIGGALLVVPLTAHLQDKSPNDKRGGVIAASNVLTNLAGVLGVVFQFTLQALGLPLGWQIGIAGITALVVTGILLKDHAETMVRFLGMAILKKVYRTDVMGAENVNKERGFLLLPNHVSYSDAVILTLACPRHLSFLVADYISKTWWAGWAVRLFRAVPISPTKAKEAIMQSAAAVKDGKAVVIYPEGQLTRTGMMNEIKPGFSLVARRAEKPVIPVYVDGLWGSVFSYSDGIFLKKWPSQLSYDIRVSFGKPIAATDATADRVRSELLKLGRECWERRETNQIIATIERYEVPSRWRGLTELEKRGLVINALQLSEVYPVQKKKRVAVIESNTDTDLILGLILPLVSDLKIESFGNASLLSGEFDGVISTNKVAKNGAISFHLTDSPSECEELYPCWVEDGRILSLSMPDPPTGPQQDYQSGAQIGSLGKLLPGISIEEGRLISACGFSCDFSGYTLDKQGFVHKAGLDEVEN